MKTYTDKGKRKYQLTYKHLEQKFRRGLELELESRDSNFDCESNTKPESKIFAT